MFSFNLIFCLFIFPCFSAKYFKLIYCSPFFFKTYFSKPQLLNFPTFQPGYLYLEPEYKKQNHNKQTKRLKHN